jgi:hypothetical protein
MKPTLHIPVIGYALAFAWATLFWGGVALCLTSCQHKAPTAIEQWWNDQQPKR